MKVQRLRRTVDEKVTNQESDVDINQADQAERRQSSSAMDHVGRLLKISEVMDEVGISRAQIYRLMNDDACPFPHPIKIGSASRWSHVEIIAWKKMMTAVRDDHVQQCK